MAADAAFTPLQPGQPLGYWQVSEILATRYDLPDQPMQGAMDAGFFLTRDRNFIPHEYPCRTAFAAAFRGRRPDVRGAPVFTRNWLPFGSPRLDLSGFWFRPTRLAAWARTRLDAAMPGRAALRLATCGGAVLFVNGTEAGHLAGYLRNREADAEVEVDLQAGSNELTVFIDDLAERDTRFFVALEWLRGPEAHAALPFDIALDVVREVEAALDTLHFERPSWREGRVALALPSPLSRAARARITVGGTAELTLDLTPGVARLELAGAGELPVGFRNVDVTLEAAGFAATRRLAVEITRTGRPPTDPAVRIAEALDHVVAHASPGAVCALARLATGRTEATTADMLETALPAVEDCWDCADFELVALLWVRARYAEMLPGALRDRLDRAILGYRYWLDEPGNDVQWYFSENHALLFHTAAYLAGHLLPGELFRRSGRSGAEQSTAGRARLDAWFDHFERWEMAEFNSAAYFPIDLKGLCALFALAPDPEIRARAGRGIARLLEIVANSCHRGVLTAAQGRAYEHSLCPAASLELSAIARLLWATEGGPAAPVHALPLLALCLRDEGLELPDLAGRAARRHPGAQEWCFAQGEDGFARLYHYKTRAYAMGSAARYRWREWGYQETLVHTRLGTEPQAQVWINHPGELIQGGFARPSYWGGSASIPRVQQYRALAIVAFDGEPPQPDFTHAWFPVAAFDETLIECDAAFARSGDGLLALIASGPLEPVTRGPSAGCELRLAGRSGRWILRLSDTASDPDLPGFRARVRGLATKEHHDGRFVIDDPDYGTVCFAPDGTVTAEGRTLDPAQWTVAGTLSEIGPGAAATPREVAGG